VVSKLVSLSTSLNLVAFTSSGTLQSNLLLVHRLVEKWCSQKPVCSQSELVLQDRGIASLFSELPIREILGNSEGLKGIKGGEA